MSLDKMGLDELVREYVLSLDREQELLGRLKVVRGEMDLVEEQVRSFERTFRPVPDDLLDTRCKLMAELQELRHELDDVLDRQAELRREISWQEYEARRRALIENQDWSLDTVQRVLELWPWRSPQVP